MSRVQFIVVNILFGKSGWYFWFWNVLQFFSFFFWMFWKSFCKFPKVAECHVLAHLLDVFVTEVGKKSFLPNPQKNFHQNVFFLQTHTHTHQHLHTNTPHTRIFFFEVPPWGQVPRWNPGPTYSVASPCTHTPTHAHQHTPHKLWIFFFLKCLPEVKSLGKTQGQLTGWLPLAHTHTNTCTHTCKLQTSWSRYCRWCLFLFFDNWVTRSRAAGHLVWNVVTS